MCTEASRTCSQHCGIYITNALYHIKREIGAYLKIHILIKSMEVYKLYGRYDIQVGSQPFRNRTHQLVLLVFSSLRIVSKTIFECKVNIML
jgi:hypothetical protein